MFNSSINFLAQSIENSPLVEKNGMKYQEYQNFFDKDSLEILDFQKNEVSLEKFADQENLPRMCVSRDAEVLKMMTIIFSSRKIKDALQDKFSVQLGKASVDIWFDYPGYQLEPHTDNSKIQLSLQIYLGQGNNPGTSLYELEKVIKEFNFKHNCGYSLLNNDKSMHGVQGDIDQQYLRKSFYVRYE